MHYLLPRSLARRIRPLVALSTAAGIIACRAAADSRVVVETATERSTARATVVKTERVPGGRPGGVGDPRRYGGDTRIYQDRGTVDPAGSYDLSLTDDGKPTTAEMVVEGKPGTYSGRIKAETRPEVQISTVTASGPLVTVTADVPNGVLLIRMRMTGDSVHGDWSLRGDGGRLSGARRNAGGKP